MLPTLSLHITDKHFPTHMHTCTWHSASSLHAIPVERVLNTVIFHRHIASHIFLYSPVFYPQHLRKPRGTRWFCSTKHFHHTHPYSHAIAPTLTAFTSLLCVPPSMVPRETRTVRVAIFLYVVVLMTLSVIVVRVLNGFREREHIFLIG